jgi:hypothetical protein
MCPMLGMLLKRTTSLSVMIRWSQWDQVLVLLLQVEVPVANAQIQFLLHHNSVQLH